MRSRRTICFLLLPEVHLLDLAGPAQVFHEAAQLGGAGYSLQYCGVEINAPSCQGLHITSLTPIADVRLVKGDMIFVPGFSFDAFVQGKLNALVAQLTPWLRHQHARGVTIASVCSGALLLAATGLLNGKKCTSHWKCIQYMIDNFPRASVQTDRIFQKDGLIYTSAGMTSGIDMALSILEEDCGPVVASKVAREMVVYLRRNEEDNQQSVYIDYRTHFNPAVHKIQDFVISHPEKDPGLSELAEMVNMSPRNLTRTFKGATGRTFVEFKNAAKIARVRDLAHNPELTIDKIASMCGFRSARHLRRIMKQYAAGPLRATRSKS